MKKINVILVENDEDELLFMQEGFLATNLFNILSVAYSGDQVAEKIRATGHPMPDLIISDLNMPGKSGLELLSDIKSDPQLAHIPLIIISTSFSPSIINKCMQGGALAYHTKPDSFIEYDRFAERIYREVFKL